MMDDNMDNKILAEKITDLHMLEIWPHEHPKKHWCYNNCFKTVLFVLDVLDNKSIDEIMEIKDNG